MMGDLFPSRIYSLLIIIKSIDMEGISMVQYYPTDSLVDIEKKVRSTSLVNCEIYQRGRVSRLANNCEIYQRGRVSRLANNCEIYQRGRVSSIADTELLLVIAHLM